MEAAQRFGFRVGERNPQLVRRLVQRDLTLAGATVRASVAELADQLIHVGLVHVVSISISSAVTASHAAVSDGIRSNTSTSSSRATTAPLASVFTRSMSTYSATTERRFDMRRSVQKFEGEFTVTFLVLVAFLIVPVALHDQRRGPLWCRFSTLYPFEPKDE